MRMVDNFWLGRNVVADRQIRLFWEEYVIRLCKLFFPGYRRQRPHIRLGLARLRSPRYELVRMLKPELLRVLALTGASVTIIDVPGVISLRAFARKVGSMDMRVARSLRFGTRLPALAIDSQSRRPLESTVANAEKAYEPRIPLSPVIGVRPISTPLR